MQVFSLAPWYGWHPFCCRYFSGPGQSWADALPIVLAPFSGPQAGAVRFILPTVSTASSLSESPAPAASVLAALCQCFPHPVGAATGLHLSWLHHAAHAWAAGCRVSGSIGCPARKPGTQHPGVHANFFSFT